MVPFCSRVPFRGAMRASIQVAKSTRGISTVMKCMMKVVPVFYEERGVFIFVC